MRSSSPSSLDCTPPDRQVPVHLAVLAVLWLASLVCLWHTALPVGVCILLAVLSSLYASRCVWQIFTAPRFGLRWQGGQIHLLHPRSAPAVLSAPSWRDYGYLVVLQGKANGIPIRQSWWCPCMPSGQRRSLRRILQTTSNLREPPSLLVNPLL